MIYRFLLTITLFLGTAPHTANAQEANNRTILVSLAYSYLETSICEDLIKAGNDLVLTGRSAEKLTALKKKLLAARPKARIEMLHTDFDMPETITSARQSLKNTSLNGIVLIGPRPRIQTPDDWHRSFAQTFTTPLALLTAFEDTLKPESSIVVISGLTSKAYMPQYPNTNVLRLAWSGHVKNLAHQYGPRKIRVYVISPGVVLTPLHEKRIQKKATANGISYHEQLAKESANSPLKQLGHPEDVAHLTHFLLSSKARHINATNVPLDGGASLAY